MSLSAPPIPLTQIHFGTGKLSVGLVVLTALEAGGEVHVVSRATTERQAGPPFACLLWRDGAQERRGLALASFSRADRPEELCPEALAALEQAPELLITTAVTASGIASFTSFLVELAQRRLGKPTVFIACENDPGEAYPPLVRSLQQLGVDVRRTVVDRLCFREEVEEDGTHVVHAEDEAEWLIEGEPDRAMLEALAHVPHVRFLPDIDPYEVRKRWLVNGAHLAVALLADRRQMATMNIEVVRRERDHWIQRLHAGWIAAFEAQFPGLDDNAAYARKQVEIWMRHDDDVLRILGGLKRANLIGFFRGLDRKIGEPTRAQVALTGRIAPESRRVFNELVRTLRKIESYRDYKLFRSGAMTLRPEVDDAAVWAYRELLTGIFPPEEVDLRARSLAAALAHHRELLGP